ncbi:MAG: DUF2190 family protein [Kofleriaceae bacterium]
MQNFISPGQNVTFTAASGGVTSGTPVLIGDLVVVSCVTADEGAPFAGETEGVFSGMPKTAGAAWTVGELLYWDSAAGSFATAKSSTARRAGCAAAPADSGDTVGIVRLDGSPSIDNVA